MSDLSDYRAAIKRLIEADDPTNEAFLKEGFDDTTAVLIRGSKSFTASQSASRHKARKQKTECGGMSHGHKKRKMA